MDSAVQIANLALARVGSKTVIADFDEDSTEAALCKVAYEPARDALLASFAWPFAIKREDVDELANVSRSGWTHCYELPNDFIAAVRIWDGNRNPRANQRIPYDIEGADALDGPGILLTDQADAELIYVARVTNVRAFHPLFVDALAWTMVQELVLSLPVKPQFLSILQQRADLGISRAKAAALNGRQPDAPPDSELISVRG